jgi:hypothetical protein
VKHGPARLPAPHTERPRQARQATWPVPQAIGAASGTGGALVAAAAGHGDTAIGLLTLTVLALACHLTAAMLRDHAFRQDASKPEPNPEVLREHNIREAIRSGQLSSEDIARVLTRDLPGEQLRQSQHRQDQSPAGPGITPWRQ